MEQITMNISGMSCGHCVSAVTKALHAIDGVDVEQVSVGSALLAYDPARTSLEQIESAIENAGYGVRPVQLGRSTK